MDKKSQLEELLPEFERARKKCPELRKTFIHYIGNPDAKVLLLGEAPGHDEEQEGHPFAGRPGELLRAVLAEVGLRKSKCYITNCLKYRPKSKDVMGKENRTPTQAELMTWRPSLLREINIIAPELIVCIGGTAAKCLTRDSDFRITEARGDYFTTPGVACEILATYHPSFLLRKGGDRCPEYKDFVADIKEAARLLA